MILVNESLGNKGATVWKLIDKGVISWSWPSIISMQAESAPAWVVNEILEALEEQGKVIDKMYDALGLGADDVMDYINGEIDQEDD